MCGTCNLRKEVDDFFTIFKPFVIQKINELIVTSHKLVLRAPSCIKLLYINQTTEQLNFYQNRQNLGRIIDDQVGEISCLLHNLYIILLYKYY